MANAFAMESHDLRRRMRFLCIAFVLLGLWQSSTGWVTHYELSSSIAQRRPNYRLHMAVFSPSQGVPAQITEERDACGVGFIASLNQKASHKILAQALMACSCMEHRGATSADQISGDGAGVMTEVPWKIIGGSSFDPDAVLNGDGSSASAVGMIFLPRDYELRNEAIEKISSCFQRNHFDIKKWRDVPIDSSVLGTLSSEFVPHIKQVLIQSSSTPKGTSASLQSFEKRLYDTRRQIQGHFRKMKTKDAYICSLSGRTIVYKGMLRSCDLPHFYKDLTNTDFTTKFAIYHRRFSTNTVPKWFLAQPMRLLAHNGEINTLLGNINWVKSRQYSTRLVNQAQNEIIEDNEEEKRVPKGPLVDVGRSDSANLDSVLDSFVRAGYSPEEALMALVPEAFENQPRLKDSPEILAFYRYFESLQEAWDGPALLVYSDGNSVGAALDRNGLRPARYMVVNEADGQDYMHMMSEVGVTKMLPLFDPQSLDKSARIIDSGRLGPGEMLSVDLSTGQVFYNNELKPRIARKRPYQQMVQDTVYTLKPAEFKAEVKHFVESYAAADNELRQQALQLIDGERGIVPGDLTTVALTLDHEKLITIQTLFGWGTEDVEVQISAMAAEGNEATFCMGDDAPLAAISALPHTLYDYFKQRFAQVTNPPIDPLREGAVMSLSMFLGPRGNPMHLETQQELRVKIKSPVLNYQEYDEVTTEVAGIKTQTLSTVYDLKTALTASGLEQELERLCQAAIIAVRDNGINILHLSDRMDSALYGRDIPVGHWQHYSYIPPLLAVGAVHHSLLQHGLRTQASIVVSSGQVWATHHVACLVGYGASAVIPYTAYDAVINWHGQKRNQLAMQRGDLPKLSVEQALSNYRKALNKGLLKILSKMGISLLTSYHGAQIFEALGLGDDVILRAFKGTASRIGGMSFDELAAECVEFSRRAFGDSILENMVAKVEDSVDNYVDDDATHKKKPDSGDVRRKKLFNYGFLNFLKSGEYHHNNQPLIKTLHAAIRDKEKADYYKLYEESISSRPPTTLRDLLQFNLHSGRPSIPLDEVEDVSSIVARFVSGGMSLGALSREAHETLAIGMNRLGAKSNSGEGGEDPLRFNPIVDVESDSESTDKAAISPTFAHLKGLRFQDSANSKIKQVASGRFGVTPGYLMSAEQLEIKIAQGAKPGEGGQLPGGKIDQYIATLRRSKPGVTLISPPPHHDIYSIEDLAQLIYDLHMIHPAAGVSVKLVSEEGIGTVASGVAKAGADIIQISGHDGGTGASPASSIKHAGTPWELGLVEAHSSLRKNGLRQRVLLRADGGLKSGYDVVMAAAMGAEEFGFGTIALIAEGCIMARICHTNQCPVGVTTQSEQLRKRFPGTPDNIVTFFGYVAEEVRHILARLGFRSLQEMIGKPGVLMPRENLQLKKTQNMDVTSYLLTALHCEPEVGENFCDVDEDRSWLDHPAHTTSGYSPNAPIDTLDDRLLQEPTVQQAIAHHGNVHVDHYLVTNTDRSAFARISGRLAQLYGDGGFQGRLRFTVRGAGGQSFGAFLGQGMEVTLHGYANDYVGKGMAGGCITIVPPVLEKSSDSNSDNVPATDSPHYRSSSQYSVVGNTVLYGATGGNLYVRGRAGERFAVRNSGATAVIEGVGDHGCEYMTGGHVVILGDIGRNFGAGMTGGLAFILPDEDWLDNRASQKKDIPARDQDSSLSVSNIDAFVNTETVSIVPLTSQHNAAKRYLRTVLSAHVTETQSRRAQRILQHLSENDASKVMQKTVAIVPVSEKGNPLLALSEVSEELSTATSTEKAVFSDTIRRT